MGRPDLVGRYACRLCHHDQFLHNLIEGCPFCRCLATPGEAEARTDPQLDNRILPPGQYAPGYAPTPEQHPASVVPPGIEGMSETALWQSVTYDLLHANRGAIYTSARYLREHPAMQEILRRERQKGVGQ